MSTTFSSSVNGLNVLVADDHEVFSDALANLIRQVPHVSQVKLAKDGLEVLDRMSEETFDILFLDIDMPRLNGIETLRRIRVMGHNTAVVVVSMHCNAGYFTEMCSLSLNGYILKNTSLEEIKRTIHVLIEGGEYYSPEILEKLKSLTFQNKITEIPDHSLADITDREREILLMVCDQLTAKEMADKLIISERTVKRHKENLLIKTGSMNQIGLAIFAIKSGIKIIENT